MTNRALGLSSSCLPIVLKNWQIASTFSSAGHVLPSGPSSSCLQQKYVYYCSLSNIFSNWEKTCKHKFFMGFPHNREKFRRPQENNSIRPVDHFTLLTSGSVAYTTSERENVKTTWKTAHTRLTIYINACKWHLISTKELFHYSSISIACDLLY